MMKSLLAAAVVTTAAAPAFAERTLPVVDASVTSVLFDRSTQTRAIAGDSDGAYLGIQRVVKGTVTDETWIEELPLGDDMIPVTQLKNLRLVTLDGATLVFQVAPRVRGAKATIQCIAQLAFEKRRVRVTSSSCDDAVASDAGGDQGGDSTPVHQHHGHGDVADLQAATTACNDAFGYSSDRQACVDATIAPSWGRFARSAPAAVTACKDAFGYSSDRMACIQLASKSTREPAALVSYCKDQNAYSSDRKACIEKYGTAGSGSVKL